MSAILSATRSSFSRNARAWANSHAGRAPNPPPWLPSLAFEPHSSKPRPAVGTPAGPSRAPSEPFSPTTPTTQRSATSRALSEASEPFPRAPTPYHVGLFEVDFASVLSTFRWVGRRLVIVAAKVAVIVARLLTGQLYELLAFGTQIGGVGGGAVARSQRRRPRRRQVEYSPGTDDLAEFDSYFPPASTPVNLPALRLHLDFPADFGDEGFSSGGIATNLDTSRVLDSETVRRLAEIERERRMWTTRANAIEGRLRAAGYRDPPRIHTVVLQLEGGEVASRHRVTYEFSGWSKDQVERLVTNGLPGALGNWAVVAEVESPQS